ncbi:CRISPR-associated helicase Cas3' [Spongiactinospora rosea]|nr:CRISPR-associated helicase Cas3' [Spongiactinospora rosea]
MEIDLDLWGKSKGLDRPYPVICHLLDAAAMAEALWESYLPPALRSFIANSLSVSEEAARKLVGFWAGLHDIGKCMACFQLQDPVAFGLLDGYPDVAGENQRHEYAAHVWLSRPLSRMGYDARSPRSAAFVVAQMLGGHHGRYSVRDHRECRAPAAAVLPELGDGKWEEQREALFSTVARIVDPPSAPPAVTPVAAELICGLVILADWLVSQDVHLIKRLPEVPTVADGLKAHYERSLHLAPSLIDEAGLAPVHLRSGTFADEFPHIETPNDLQRSISENLPHLLSGGPGLLLVTAPMGAGKTEAVFHGARLLGEASGVPGFLFTLPTMATADQMYGRTRAYGERRAEDDAALTLLHSMSWLNDAYTGTGTDSTVITDDTSLRAPEWLHGRKRGLLASMGVGTVDQALLAVLPLKHSALRMLGLATKVLIVDEVHAYDAYMQGLLAETLTWLGALGVPVVLMSATLPTRIASRLMAAYLRGAGHPDSPLPSIRYPGWAYADATTGQISSFDVTAKAVDLHLEVRQAPISGAVMDRSAALRELLNPLVENGGCAAVVCNTVAEAQETYRFLMKWFDGLQTDSVPELTLLHARFPARRREELTRQVTADFGKCSTCEDLAACEHRPHAAVLVATQVIEQSLDLDFDLLISDLAPIALLLQRAGRCHRHDGRIRPSWAAVPRLAVLRPSRADGGLALPGSWPFVYSRALLRRTDELLNDRVIAIPDDVQGLVEEVYDDAFASGQLDDDALEWLGQEMAGLSMADVTAIPDPDEISSLHEFTMSEASEDLISTRLGADSVRVLCAYTGDDGALYLDRDCSTKLPDLEKIPRRLIKQVLAETIPLRAGLLKDRDIATDPPASWGSNAWLRDITIISLKRDTEGYFSKSVGPKRFVLDERLGLWIREGEQE